MFKIIFTSDYEIHGHGTGSPKHLMVDSTDLMLNLFNRYGAKLTIMADAAQILKFSEYKQNTGSDDFFYESISEQLKNAVKTGHDVQLHIHPSFFNAEYIDGRWAQDFKEFDVARLAYDRINNIIGRCKTFLENLLQQVKPDYKCYVFRAANWSMQPSSNIINALINNDIKIDTSVFKYGKYDYPVKFDYTDAYNSLIPWPVSVNDINLLDINGRLIEIPIYCENRSILAFLSVNRFISLIKWKFQLESSKQDDSKSDKNSNINSHDANNTQNITNIFNKAMKIFKKYPWKLDFNKCTGGQLIQGIKSLEKKYKSVPVDLPVVLIGHSKDFTKANEKSLTSFLEYINENQKRFTFGLFEDVNIDAIINYVTKI